MLHVTNCSFAYTITVPEYNSAQSPVQHNQHLHILQQRHHVSFPFIPGLFTNQTIQTQVQESTAETAINTVKVHCVE